MTETNESAPGQQQTSTPSGNVFVTDTLLAADAMHAELLRQCEALMGCEEGSPESATLGRLASIVENYEQARWPL